VRSAARTSNPSMPPAARQVAILKRPCTLRLPKPAGVAGTRRRGSGPGPGRPGR
jgi:hypothetical protein